MGDGTAIEWTDATWNPVRGCSRVSAGCENCYAERVAARFSGPGQPYEGLARITYPTDTGAHRPEDQKSARYHWTGVVQLVPHHLADPLRWQKPRRIFVNSMSDLFHEKLTNEEIAVVFGVMAAAPRHTFQVLTKRPERMLRWFDWVQNEPALGCGAIDYCTETAIDEVAPFIDATRVRDFAKEWPLPNVWLGVSTEDQATADERIPKLLETPAAIRFISAEPLLGPIDLYGREPGHRWLKSDLLGSPRIDWVIAGGESGPNARPTHRDWVRSLRDQCQGSCVPFFFKQWGEWAPACDVDLWDPRMGDNQNATATIRVGKKRAGRTLDNFVWNQFPAPRVAP